MALPKITEETIQSFVADLKYGGDELEPSNLAKRMKADNPTLLEAIARLSPRGGIPEVLYICEIIDRQLESDLLSARWEDEIDQ